MMLGCAFFLLPAETFFKAIAFTVHLQDVTAVSQSVEKSGGQLLRAEQLSPVGKRQVCGDNGRVSLIAIIDDL